MSEGGGSLEPKDYSERNAAMTDEQKTDHKIKRFTGQLDAVLASIEKLREQVTAMKQQLEGENPVGDVLKHFDLSWMALYTRGASPAVHYEFNGAKDAGQVKRLLKTMDANTLKNRMTNYLRDRDDFLVRQKHPFNVFISRVNTYAATTKFGTSVTTAVGCLHVPPCATDAEHTGKRLAETRKLDAPF